MPSQYSETYATSERKSLTAAASMLLDQSPPPSLRDILGAYKARGDGDRDMLLAMLNAKAAEDNRLASVASLHRTLLEAYQQPSDTVDHYYDRSLHGRSSYERGSHQNDRLRSRSRSRSPPPRRESSRKPLAEYAPLSPASSVHSNRASDSMAIDSLLQKENTHHAPLPSP